MPIDELAEVMVSYETPVGIVMGLPSQSVKVKEKQRKLCELLNRAVEVVFSVPSEISPTVAVATAKSLVVADACVPV